MPDSGHTTRLARTTTRSLTALALLALSAPMATAQTFSQRGFVEGTLSLFPSTAVNDSRRVIADAHLRYEPGVRLAPWLRVAAGLDARIDSSGEVDRRWTLDVQDRGLRRPALSMRQLQVSLSHGPVQVDIGRQFIRWGKADVVNPTDRFAVRDVLGVVDSELLGVTGVRATIGNDRTTLDAAFVPRMTPSRAPLVDRRWTVLPEPAQDLTILDGSASLPTTPQVGLRVNHIGAGFEASAMVYDGVQSLPRIDARVVPTAFAPSGVVVVLSRTYSPLRAVGADAAWPLPWCTVRAEAAFLESPDRSADDYVLAVVQIERQVGEWSMVAGYAGEHVTADRTAADFSPERGLARAVIGRVAYTIGATRSVSAEGALRQNGDGAWLKGTWTQTMGAHVRLSLVGHLIGGRDRDFLGQYRRNGHLRTEVRWSF
ncbi:MAG: hypothetical protein U0Q12_03915 [Vicinamibacterales bacterium]